MKTIAATLFAFLALLLASQNIFADSNQQDSSNRQGPPPEATTACEGKSAGDSAEFEGRNGDSITGTCEEMNGQLILRPDNPPNGQNNQQASSGGQGGQQSNSDNQNGDRQGPPPEAITACEGMSAGDSASFEGKEGDSVTGTCEDMNGQLILRPDNAPQGQRS
jgi:hypothetical protein